MKTTYLLLIFITIASIIFTACEKNEIKITSNLTYPSQMDLDKLEVGQVFHFKRILMPTFFTDTFEVLQYKDEILEIQILEELEPRVFKVSEKLYYSNDEFRDADFDDSVQNLDDRVLLTKWDLKYDYLTIEPWDETEEMWKGSHFFWEGTYDLRPFSVYHKEASLDNFHFYYRCYEADRKFYFTDTEIGNYFYDTLNVKLNNESLSFQHVGNTLIYSRKHGIVRLLGYAYDANFASGWERIRF